MADVVAVKLVYDGELRVVAVEANSPLDELQGCIGAVFQCEPNVIAVRDVDSNVVFPISFLIANPVPFSESVYELVLGAPWGEDEDYVNEYDEYDDESEDMEQYHHQQQQQQQQQDHQRMQQEQEYSETDSSMAAQLGEMSLGEKISSVRQSVGLSKLDAIHLSRLLSRHSETDEIITREEFEAAMQTLENTPGKNSLVSLLFDVFSQGAEFSMISELVNGLSVFCGGGMAEKVLNSFALQDTDRDGYISRTDMVTYMRSVFTLLFQISPDLGAAAGCEPEDLAVRTTSHAFQSMGLKSKELMSFAQYKVWYVNEDIEQAGSCNKISEAQIADPSSDESSEGEERYEEEDESGDGGGDDEDVDIFAVQELLALHESKATDVVSSFIMFADEYGRLARPKYFGVFDQLLCARRSQLNAATQDVIERIAERIFNVYEIAESGYLNVRSLSSGLSLFCGGSWDDKALAVFMAFGITGVGKTRITRDVMTQHIISIFAMMSEFDPSFLSDSTAVAVAQDMVKNAFATMPIDPALGEAVMSCSQFANWLSSSGDKTLGSNGSNGSNGNNYSGSNYTGGSGGGRGDDLVLLTDILESSGESSDDEEDYEEERGHRFSAEGATDEASGSLIQEELKFAKKTLGLTMFSADDLLDVVGEFSKEGVISAVSWDEAILHMLTLSGVPTSQFPVALELARSLFDQLDAPGLRAVDYSSLILSLAGFCNSPLEDRVMVAFTVLEAVRGAEVDYDELLRYFRSMFMAATVLSPSLLATMVQRHLNPDKLAELILDEALDKLNFTETNQQYFNLENMTEIAEFCLEQLG
jgi:Ca2+-binding EF-hand superfamily protein